MTDNQGNPLLARIEVLKAEIEANGEHRKAAYSEENWLEHEGPKLQAELDSLLREWVKRRSPEEAWKYWIGRANREEVRIYLGPHGGIEVVDWNSLEREEKEEYRENWELATIRDVPNRETILEVIEACEVSELFQDDKVTGEPDGERIKELKAMLRDSDKNYKKARIIRQRIEEEGLRLENQLHSLTLQWLEGREPEELWQYWIARAEAWDYRLFYLDSGDAIEVDIREAYEEDIPPGFTLATLEAIPSGKVIEAVSNHAEVSGLFRYE